MKAVICDAIHQRRLLRFFYNPDYRTVEPYAYGAGEGGRELLRAYQVEDGSASRESGWKLFRVEEMQDVAKLDAKFAEPRPGYLRNDPSMSVIYGEV